MTEETRSEPARQTVHRLVGETLEQGGKSAGELSDETGLFADGVGLDSLEFATLVVRLEQATGYDPFRSGEVERLPRTLGELVTIYEKKLGD